MDSPLVNKLEEMQRSRQERMKKMVEKLHALGLNGVDFDEVCAKTRSDAVGRLHLAKLLVEKKYVTSIDAAFEKYLAEGARAYFPKFQQTAF